MSTSTTTVKGRTLINIYIYIFFFVFLEGKQILILVRIMKLVIRLFVSIFSSFLHAHCNFIIKNFRNIIFLQFFFFFFKITCNRNNELNYLHNQVVYSLTCFAFKLLWEWKDVSWNDNSPPFIIFFVCVY